MAPPRPLEGDKSLNYKGNSSAVHIPPVRQVISADTSQFESSHTENFFTNLLQRNAEWVRFYAVPNPDHSRVNSLLVIQEELDTGGDIANRNDHCGGLGLS